jgi:UPF0716 protein FxsA
LIPIILLAVVLVPIAEIAVFIEVGGVIGVLPTIGLVIAIAIFGTWLLRRQGLATFTKAQAALNRGEMPVDEVLDGLFLIFAALLMMAPGLLTDALGFVLLVPAVRRFLRPFIRRWALARAGTTIVYSDVYRSQGWPQDGSAGPIIEGEGYTVEPGDENGKPRPGPTVIGDSRPPEKDG